MQDMIRNVLMAYDRWRRPRNRDYPQTWWYVPYNIRAVRMLQWLCGRVVGHELSETEHGYGGDRFEDRWCRWCNKLIQIPIEESIWMKVAGASLWSAHGDEV